MGALTRLKVGLLGVLTPRRVAFAAALAFEEGFEAFFEPVECVSIGQWVEMRIVSGSSHRDQ